MRKQMSFALALLPIAGSAEMHDQLYSGFLVDDVAYCEQMVDVDLELHVWNVVQAGGMTFGAFGTASEEIDCWFDEEITFSWSEPSTQMTLGACYVADRVQPQVFVVEMFSDLPGLVQLWEQGADEALTFHVCGAPGH